MVRSWVGVEKRKQDLLDEAFTVLAIDEYLVASSID